MEIPFKIVLNKDHWVEDDYESDSDEYELVEMNEDGYPVYSNGEESVVYDYENETVLDITPNE